MKSDEPSSPHASPAHVHHWTLVTDAYGGSMSYDTLPPMYDWHCACGAIVRCAERDLECSPARPPRGDAQP